MLNLDTMAREVVALAQPDAGTDPRFLALDLGLEIAHSAGPELADSCTTAARVVITWSASQAERDEATLTGIAQAVLLRRAVPHVRADVYALAAAVSGLLTER